MLDYGEDVATPANPAATPSELAAESATLLRRTSDYISAARAPNTLRGYFADWHHFTGWCARHHAPSFPPTPGSSPFTSPPSPKARANHDGVRSERPRRVTTLDRRLSAIRHLHRAASHELDTTTPSSAIPGAASAARSACPPRQSSDGHRVSARHARHAPVVRLRGP